MSNRNPFRLRASQHFVADDTFVRMFAPGVLEVLPEGEGLWTRVLILRSAPGGGKTSLFRLFTPGGLDAAYSFRGQENFRETYQHLRRLGVCSETGPEVLGVLLSFSSDFRTLDELNDSEKINDRVFCALLNARLVLAMLRASIEQAGLAYPADLDRLKVKQATTDATPIPDVASGAELHRWASLIETDVFEALDNLSDAVTDLPGHEGIFALQWFSHVDLEVDGEPVTRKRLIMLDEVQTLSVKQRTRLLDRLAQARLPLAVWVAERLEALQTTDLLSLGARIGRDYEAQIELEDQWRGASSGKFHKFTSRIAELRAEQATGFEARSFEPHLAATLDGHRWDARFSVGLADVQTRVQELARDNPRYQSWLAQREQEGGSPQERCIAWRSLEILIERDKRKDQGVFNFDLLSSGELVERDNSAIRSAAEFFLSSELNVPYYYGMDRLVALASANTEQFIDFAGDLFEEMVSAVIIRRQPTIDPLRQQEILQAAAKERWRAIPFSTVNGYQATRLLEAIGQFCREQTLRPNAPYAPGVTGIAISMAERARLVEAGEKAPQSELGQLAATLASCVAQNLLEVRMDMPNKGQHWLVLYLNRMLCLHFHLPLGYGGWRPQKPVDLVKWAERGAGAVTQPRLT